MIYALTLTATKLWRDYPREAAAIGALGAAVAATIAVASYSAPGVTDVGSEAARAANAPPAPPPLLVRQLAPEDALSINRAIPIADSPNPAARPFVLAGAGQADRARALDCLTSAVYYEAGSESSDGAKAVAQVVLNRVRHPAFPSSVCDVVYQGSTRATGCQFTFTCDGSLARRPSVDGWTRAHKIAQAALTGTVYAPAGYATHYHADFVVPYWASSLVKNTVVGAHIFYRWAGGWGRPAAFAKRYAGHEPNAQALRTAAMAAEAAQGSATVNGVTGIPGVEVGKDGRVAVHFSVAARKAVEDAPHKDYVDKFEASDNLRWTLSGGGSAAPQSSEKPLGGTLPVAAAAAAVVGGGGSGAPQH